MIRQATEKDAFEIEKIDREAFGKGGITQTMIRSQLNVFPDGAFVAVQGKKVVGVAFCEQHQKRLFPPYVHDVGRTHSDKGKLFYLSVITISKKFRSKGIGSMLLKAIDKLADSSGGQRIYCPVNKLHPYLKEGVLHFWEKNAYQITGETSWEVAPGKYLKSYIFEKVI
ncbi:MAG TPA: GNAT family N-acetyltransferase [Candidatus Bathyarchaeia archaeon]|nr:GNAT family N-acetyltransferase [Candidatus Bathyarchaeia archaeon]